MKNIMCMDLSDVIKAIKLESIKTFSYNSYIISGLPEIL